MFNIPEGKKLILFDGVCNLCENSVQKVIKYDKKENFVFASLQSEIGEKVISHLGINPEDTDSIIVYDPDVAYYIKSCAALEIMSGFGGFWKLTKVFWIIPSPIRNWVYDYVAKNRYKWYGKKDACMIPTPELKARFLD